MAAHVVMSLVRFPLDHAWNSMWVQPRRTQVMTEGLPDCQPYLHSTRQDEKRMSARKDGPEGYPSRRTKADPRSGRRKEALKERWSGGEVLQILKARFNFAPIDTACILIIDPSLVPPDPEGRTL